MALKEKLRSIWNLLSSGIWHSAVWYSRIIFSVKSAATIFGTSLNLFLPTTLHFVTGSKANNLHTQRCKNLISHGLLLASELRNVSVFCICGRKNHITDCCWIAQLEMSALMKSQKVIVMLGCMYGMQALSTDSGKKTWWFLGFKSWQKQDFHLL